MAGTWGDLNNVANAPGGIFNRMTQPPANPVARPTPKATNTPTGPAPYTGGGDIWERIQNETRRGAMRDDYEFGGSLMQSGRDGDLFYKEDGQPSWLKPMMDKYGVTASYVAPYQTGPSGEGALVENKGGGYIADSRGTFDPEKLPKTVFGKDFITISEKDKYKVLDPKYITWDDNYGWITHNKNYNQNGDESWFMQNAKTIMPALFTMGLGAAGVAPGILSSMSLGRGAVDYLGGNRSMQSLLPQLISAGLPFIPGFGDLGRLAQGLTRAGTGFFSNMLLNNNRGGRG